MVFSVVCLPGTDNKMLMMAFTNERKLQPCGTGTLVDNPDAPLVDKGGLIIFRAIRVNYQVPPSPSLYKQTLLFQPGRRWGGGRLSSYPCQEPLLQVFLLLESKLLIIPTCVSSLSLTGDKVAAGFAVVPGVKVVILFADVVAAIFVVTVVKTSAAIVVISFVVTVVGGSVTFEQRERFSNYIYMEYKN